MRRRHVLAALGLLAPACAPAATGHRSTTGLSANPPAEPAGPDTATSLNGPAKSPSGAGLAPAPDGPTSTMVVVTTTSTVRTPATTIAVPVPAAAAVELLPELDDEGLTDAEWWEAQPGYQTDTRTAVLACIRSYEQGDAGYATDTGNGFYGAYQFDLVTWRSVGGAGNPAHASPAEQDERAWQLYLRRGMAPWPTPARRCS